MTTFADYEKKILSRFVTNLDGQVFALKNLPEVIKGAIFSRYSRSRLGLRSLLLKEFIDGDRSQSHFQEILGGGGVETPDEQTLAIKKAQDFYDRILDGYGDDSIGELGGAHLALEKISMLAAKEIEECRIGGSPLEKSTRYIPFDEKENGEYLFYREPTLLASAYRENYLATCRHLFDTYADLIPSLMEDFEKRYPKDPEILPGAYQSALRAKVLDAIRGLLPASTLTNVGVFGNGRFFEGLLMKLHAHAMSEMQDLGRKGFEELSKVIPSFVRRASPNHKTFQSYTRFREEMEGELKRVFAKRSFDKIHSEKTVSLFDISRDAVEKVCGALLFEFGDSSLEEIDRQVKEMGAEEVEEILEAAASARENRRHKSPRALEHASFTFEILSDFATYRDLQRHRMLTQKRQLVTCDHGYLLPEELEGTPFEAKYRDAMDRARDTFELIRRELPHEAQYVVPMGYQVRWYFHINLRALQWLCELRSGPAGHTNYRRIAQEMARQVTQKVPSFERFFKFVDYSGYDLGRMGQESRREAKKVASTS